MEHSEFWKHSPVLVEPPLALITQVLGKDGLQCPQPTGRLNVTNDTHNHQGWGLNNGDSFNDLMLMGFCTK